MYCETKTGQEHQEGITEKIGEWEVGDVIGQLNRRKAVGTDNITAEILGETRIGSHHA